MPNRKYEYSSCEYYLRNYTTLSEMSYADALSNIQEQQQYSLRAPCTSWIYNASIYSSTLVSEWNLVCGNRAWMSTVQSVYLCGILFSSIICGMLSDRFGRRPVFRSCLILWLIVNCIEAFAYDYFTYIVFRFFIAFFATGCYIVGYVLVTEVCGSSHRCTLGMVYHMPFAFGFMAIPGAAYLIRDWRYLQYLFSFSNIIAIVCFWYFPESPRWLIVNKRTKEAKQILLEAAKVNGKIISELEVEDIIDKVQHVNKQDIMVSNPTRTICGKISKLIPKPLSLIRTREMCKRTVISYFGWFVVSLMYYGLVLNGIHLPFNPYLVTFIMAAVEIPGVLIAIPLIDKFGRRSIISLAFIIASVSCFLQMVPPTDLGWLITSFAVFAKLCITSTFSIIYLFEAELFPTEVRNIAIGGASIFARFGGIASPYIIDLVGSINSTYPIIIFGTMGLLAGFSMLLLPETNNKKLPETIEEIEASRRNVIKST